MTLIRSEEVGRRYETPPFPDFPKSEWRRRIDSVQERMKEEGIDVLVLWMRENCRYFSGFQSVHWLTDIHPVIDVIPVEGDPTLIVPELFKCNAEGICWERDIRAQKKPHKLTSIRELPKDVASVVKDRGYESATIGLETGSLGGMWIPRPLSDIEVFKNELPDADFADADRVIWDCRMIKSAFEIERLRRASQDIGRALTRIRDEFRPGMMEKDVQNIWLEEAAMENIRGEDSYVGSHIVCGLSKEGMADVLAFDNITIDSDSYLSVDLFQKHKGYILDRARTFQVGSVSKEVEEAHRAVNEGLVNAEEILEPGIKANDIFKAAYEPIAEIGYDELDMAGHGVGYVMHEPPYITEENEMTIKEGMVLSIEPWIWEPKEQGGIGVIGIQDNYVITDDGYEILDENPSIWKYKVAHPFRE